MRRRIFALLLAAWMAGVPCTVLAKAPETSSQGREAPAWETNVSDRLLCFWIATLGIVGVGAAGLVCYTERHGP